MILMENYDELLMPLVSLCYKMQLIFLGLPEITAKLKCNNGLKCVRGGWGREGGYF